MEILLLLIIVLVLIYIAAQHKSLIQMRNSEKLDGVIGDVMPNISRLTLSDEVRKEIADFLSIYPEISGPLHFMSDQIQEQTDEGEKKKMQTIKKSLLNEVEFAKKFMKERGATQHEMYYLIWQYLRKIGSDFPNMDPKEQSFEDHVEFGPFRTFFQLHKA